MAKDAVTVGQMRDRVQLQQPTRPAADSFGQRQPTFSTVATVWACVQEMGGQEMTQTQQQREVTRYTITIRYYPGLSSSWQLIFNGTTINLQSATNPDRKRVRHELTGTSFGDGGSI